MPIADDRLSKLQSLKLLQAVNKQDVQLITKLVDQGIPDLVNYAEPVDGQCGLHLAACANSELMIQTLINLGADCNVADKQGRTPFIRAAEFGHIQALNLLIESCEKPDLSARDAEGKNILYYCLCPTKRHETCLETVIRFGANVHNVGHDGKSLLIKTCEDGLEKALKTFLEAGIDVNRQSEKTGETALHFACLLGFEECVRLLLKYSADPNILDDMKLHAAHKAAKNGHLGILRILSAYGAKLDCTNGNRDNPMHFAALYGHGAACKFLGQRGCPATVKNSNGSIPRAVAKANEHKEALKECKKAEKYKGVKPGTQVHIVKFYDWVIEKKSDLESDVKEYDPVDTTKGKSSGRIGKQEFLAILIAHKVPLDEAALLPILTLHDSQKNGKIDYELFFIGKKYVNKLFLVDGGKKKKKAKGGGKKGGKKKGKTKIDVPICTNGNLVRSKEGGPLANYLEKQHQLTDYTRFDRDNQPEHPIQDDSQWYSYKPDTTFIHINEVIKYNDRESLKMAVRNGLDVNQKNKYFKTPLMLACMEGNIEVVKYLIEHGADVTTQDNFKWTALHFACHVGQKDVVELLLNNGANLDAQSYNGGTPLMRAIESSTIDVVKFLIEKGAKIQLENKKGQTALDIAKAYADPRIIAIIQKRFDQLPPPIDKRKGKKGSPKKKANTSKSSSRISMPNIQVSVHNEEVIHEEDRKSSVLRAASALADGRPLHESIAYTPKKAWMPQSNTKELLSEREVRRDRFGYEIDFDDYKPPFEKHIDNLVQTMDDTDD